MPAIAKLLNGLKSADIPFDYFFIIREQNRKYNLIYQIDEFPGSKFYMVYPNKFLLKVKNISPVFSFFDTFIDLDIASKLNTRHKKDKATNTFYIDRNNVRIGAVLSKLFRYNVILRLHGVINMYNDFANLFYRVRNFFKYMSYKSNFKYIICTEDGTAGKEFIEKYTSSKSMHTILLNGVDRNYEIHENIREKYNIRYDIPIILFLTRIESYKGIKVFLESMMGLYDKKLLFHAIVVGDGSILHEMKKLVKDYSNITFPGSIAHSEVSAYFSSADIYVNLNFPGNLPNTVLESLIFENCIITYGPEIDICNNISTHRILRDNVIYINRKNGDKGKDELIEKLEYLLSDKEAVNYKKRRSKLLSNQILPSWESRITKEIEIITETF